MRYAFTLDIWPALTLLEVPLYITNRYGRTIEHGKGKNGSVDAGLLGGSAKSWDFSETQRAW